MKKTAFIVIFHFFVIAALKSQINLNNLCDSNYVLSNEEKAFCIDQLRSKYDFTIKNDDTLDFVQINYLVVSPDTVTGGLTFKIDKTRSILFFPQFASDLYYTYQPNPQYLFQMGVDRARTFHKPFLIANEFGDQCIFILELYPYLNEMNTILSLSEKKDLHILNHQYLLFSSLEEYMEYSFGSIDNYVEMYKKRIKFRKKWYKPQPPSKGYILNSEELQKLKLIMSGADN